MINNNVTAVQPENIDNYTYAVMIKKYTYFAGMRITTNNALTKSTDTFYQDVLPLEREYVFITDSSIGPSVVNQSSHTHVTYSKTAGYND